jgi:hypothetical protein
MPVEWDFDMLNLAWSAPGAERKWRRWVVESVQQFGLESLPLDFGGAEQVPNGQFEIALIEKEFLERVRDALSAHNELVLNVVDFIYGAQSHLDAKFRELAELPSGPSEGTFLGDYFRLINTNRPQAERDAALERLAVRFRKWPKSPKAKEALLKLAHERGQAKSAVLTGVMPGAILLACSRVDEEQFIRLDRRWLKGADGRRRLVIPSREFTLQIDSADEFRRYLCRKIDKFVEDELVEHSGVQPEETKGALYELFDDDHFEKKLDTPPRCDSSLDVLDTILRRDDIDLIDSADLGGLNPRDRKRWERLRKRVARVLSQN